MAREEVKGMEKNELQTQVDELMLTACNYVSEKLKSESGMSESESLLVSRLFDTLADFKSDFSN